MSGEYLCVSVVPVKHSGIAFKQPVNEAHEPGRLAARERVPHLLCQDCHSQKIREIHILLDILHWPSQGHV